MVSDGYVKYEEAETHRLKWPTTAILDFNSVKFVMSYPCVRHSILFYIHGPAILLFFELLNYHKITKIKMAAQRLF